jgi:heat shock protein HslJ
MKSSMMVRALGLWSLALALWLLGTVGASLAQQAEFPFDSEMFLDAAPMPGSKRIPNIVVQPTGAIVLEMWCNRVEGQVVVAGDTITVMLGQPTERSCTPEQTDRDAELLKAFTETTNWRWECDDLLLIGAKTLRFKEATH